ncbi:hypothetical protein EGR_09771 [Echinococcus granulosus]|uniref:Uncharacterized protein n=1 Tax=Echinococcus granulosus TaxID=6210 RepID=W6U2M0_ECHGR|nr:hypothetical protein EGR_09771 [Echinococcus granulosus]EUB55365.1 hypothetical protein EGR_09771 [Echinococcus granulosus]
MDDLGKDVAYFNSILYSIFVEERRAEDLYQDIRSGLKRSVVRVEKDKDKVEKGGDLSGSLILEIENALSKAKIALEKSELMAEKASKISKQTIGNPQAYRKPQKMPYTVDLNKPKSQMEMVNRSITSGNHKCDSTTSKHRVRTERAPSEVDLLRRRAQSWLSTSFFDNSQADVAESDNFAQESTGSPKVVAPTNRSLTTKAQNINDLEGKDYWDFDSNTIKRINDVIALSKSVEIFSKEGQLSANDTSARESFLAYCSNLFRDISGDIDTSVARPYFAKNLPKLVELLEQFFRVLDVVDWNVAAPGQRQWRDQMLENFIALFNIAEHFKPLLLGNESTCVKAANPSRQKDSAPSIETIWRAYVYSGQKLPSSYAEPPIEIPSRAFRLTHGPAVFSNHPEVHRDLHQMVDIWGDIFRLQRRLKFLDYIENRLPHWLRLIAEQSTEKASALRLLCQIACDCYPVMVEKE